MDSDYTLSEESAKEQLDLFFEFYDVDFETLYEEDGSNKVKNKIEKKLIKAIRQGKVEFENTQEEFLVKQNLRNGNQFVYHEPTGHMMSQLDKYKSQHDKMYNILAMLSKKPVDKIKSISGPDLSIAEFIGLIFLNL